tara:strand:- start:3165 stop:3683 length:519 start_codon:yes stop_codon:yes gene_type:complete
MAADISAIAFFAPIAGFLLVFIVIYAILARAKILGDDKIWLNLFVALFIASIFVSVVGVRQLVQTIVPWFAVLFISLFLILLLTKFVGNIEFMEKGIGIAFVILLGIVFLVSAFVVFSDVIVKYVPGPGYGFGGDDNVLTITDWIYSPRVGGAILLVLISAVVAWVLVKSGK